MLIRTEHLCRTYKNGNNEVKALSDVELNIDKGEYVAIVGSSGSGKSTLMNILGMLDLPDKGEYYFENNNVRFLSDKKLSEIRNEKIGFIFQSFNLINGMTVLENVSRP